MSKRFSDIALLSYRERGYVPEAMINFLALLGWHPHGDKEVLSREELIAEFDIDRVQQSGAVFNEEKLDWLNREHIKAMPIAEVAALAAPFFAKQNIMVRDEALLERVIAVQIAREDARGTCDRERILFCRAGIRTEVTHLERFFHAQRSCGSFKRRARGDQRHCRRGFQPRDADRVPAAHRWRAQQGSGALAFARCRFRPGQLPHPIEIMSVIGKDESLHRIDAAIKKAEA